MTTAQAGVCGAVPSKLRPVHLAHIVDRHADDVVDCADDRLAGRALAGCLAINGGSARACVRIAEHTHATRRVATASVGPAMTLLGVAARRRGVTVRSIWGATLKDNFVGPAVYADYLSEALGNGTHRAPTTPKIVGNEINTVQTGFDTIRKGCRPRRWSSDCESRT